MESFVMRDILINYGLNFKCLCLIYIEIKEDLDNMFINCRKFRDIW